MIPNFQTLRISRERKEMIYSIHKNYFINLFFQKKKIKDTNSKTYLIYISRRDNMNQDYDNIHNKYSKDWIYYCFIFFPIACLLLPGFTGVWFMYSTVQYVQYTLTL